MHDRIDAEFTDAELNIQIDPDIADLVPGFIENRRQDVVALRLALADRDYARVKLIGHTMKGVGGAYGFPLISEIGEGLERAGAASDVTLAGRCARRLECYLERVTVVEGH